MDFMKSMCIRKSSGEKCEKTKNIHYLQKTFQEACILQKLRVNQDQGLKILQSSVLMKIVEKYKIKIAKDTLHQFVQFHAAGLFQDGKATLNQRI